MSKMTVTKMLLWMVLSLVVACNKDVETISPVTEVQTVHYRASIRTDVDTRATLGEGMVYKFASGDRVYLESEDGTLYGFLDMEDAGDVGKHEASFAGILTYVGTLPRDPNPPVRLVLVSGTDDLHTVTDGKVDAVSGGSYGLDTWAPSLEDAVSRLSHFTGSGHMMDGSFTLQQQSSFLRCSVNMTTGQAPVGRVITARLLNDSVPLREVSVAVTQAGKLPFVFAFLGGGVSLENAKLVIEWTDADNADQSKDFTVADQTLAANTYYSITRSTFSYDGFCITAILNGTTITFNYDGIQYSVDYGDTWIPYSAQFTLNAGEAAWIKGNRTNYTNSGTDAHGTPSNKPIFEANKKCYISGNIMSLLADENSLAEGAFHGAFSKGTTEVTYIDVDPDNPLILPKLASRCYLQMFRSCTSLSSLAGIKLPSGSAALSPRCFDSMFYGCTGITSIPDGFLPYTQLAFACYRRMFEACTNLVNVPANLLPALNLEKACYIRMFWGCSKLEVAPDLLATTPAPACYFQLFRNCTKIRYVKCLMLLTEAQRAGYANPNTSKYNNDADPPASNLEIWDMISSWSVFNKWLVNTSNQPLNNVSSAQFIKHPDMSYWRTNNPPGFSSVNWMGVVPSNWSMTDYTEPINW